MWPTVHWVGRCPCHENTTRGFNMAHRLNQSLSSHLAIHVADHLLKQWIPWGKPTVADPGAYLRPLTTRRVAKVKGKARPSCSILNGMCPASLGRAALIGRKDHPPTQPTPQPLCPTIPGGSWGGGGSRVDSSCYGNNRKGQRSGGIGPLAFIPSTIRSESLS